MTLPASIGTMHPPTEPGIGLHDRFFARSTTTWPPEVFYHDRRELNHLARTGSLMWMTFGLACCAIEMMQMSMPRHEVERFGFAPRASPRQSDVVIGAGNIAQQNGAGFAQYDQMPDRSARTARSATRALAPVAMLSVRLTNGPIKAQS